MSRTSVCGSWGAIAGELRYFADRFGVPRAAIEGTQIPFDLIRRYATHSAPVLEYDPQRKRSPLVLTRVVEYYGFELGREREPIDSFSGDTGPAARRALAEALARFEAKHPAVKRNRAAIEEIREVYRRSGGTTTRFGFPELAAWYERKLDGVQSLDDFRAADLTLDPDAIVPRSARMTWLALPDFVMVRDREIPLEYDVEDGAGGIVRLRLPEKMARTLVESELPALDRPLRFVVPRGQRGAARATTLDELQDLLDRPWMPEEVQHASRRHPRHDARKGRGKGRRRR